MISPNNIKKSQAKHILELVEQMTRAEILARLGPFKFSEFADYYTISLKKKEELLEYIFGTSSLVDLGKRWKILKRSGKVKCGTVKKSKKTSN